MAYTFGAGTGDDLTFAAGVSMLASTNSMFVAGWWRPTTLTATRGLWSAANIWGAEIDTTTDELRLRSDNTTDGQWTTTGVDLVVNEWKFLVFLATCTNTGPTVAWRVWAGDANTPPQPVTVTQAVAPAGNCVGAANFYMGNKGTGTLAFQGDIGSFYMHSSAASLNTPHPFFLSATSSISDGEAQLFYERFVLPMWRGDGLAALSRVAHSNSPNTEQDRVYYCSMDANPIVYVLNKSNVTVANSLVPTINGATYSQNREPRPLRIGHALYPPPVQSGS